ncbi:hypothetical protein CASFOL_019655 [Castilleja foliolosa]|uniref:RanBP2-type domain-containing protein n=1 Tax=Castilleja foliolosa TaxID=1961234 RepID=A0ABD3D502_9LAMI
MASSRLLMVLASPITRNFCNISQTRPLHFNYLLPSLQHLKRYSSSCSASTVDFGSSTLTTDNSSSISSHPWPEWVNFVDGLKAKGYLTQNAAPSENDGGADDDGGLVLHTESKLVKDACLSFARDRFDIFKSLSTQDVQTIVEKGCPKLFRKAVNSSKRLRAYTGLDEGDVCSNCSLRGSCDRAYVMLSDSESAARTVDVVRILLVYALDPLFISGENKPPGRELVESSVRKLLSQLIELGETIIDPDIPKPAAVTSQRKKQPIGLSGKPINIEMKTGDWVCDKCNFMNFARNIKCLKCEAERHNIIAADAVMKKGDWHCPKCNFMNFARNTQCRKCETERPNNIVAVDEVMREGDWNCPKCSFMNFASKTQCFRCQEPRPKRQLKPGDWECPDCDFVNFSWNTVCRMCNLDRPIESGKDQGTWKKPY